MNPIKVEITNYRQVDKGSLKGFFTLIINPLGQKILNCKYFVKDDARWWAFPAQERVLQDGKKEFIPLISYTDKGYYDALKSAVLEVLKTSKPQGNYGQAQNPRHQGQEDTLQATASPDWF